MEKDKISADEMLKALKKIKAVCWSHYSEEDHKFNHKECPFYFCTYDQDTLYEGCAIKDQCEPAFWNLKEKINLRFFVSDD